VVAATPHHLRADPDLDEIRTILGALVARPDRSVDGIQALDDRFGRRADEILARLDGLAAAYETIATEVRADHRSLVELATAVDRLSERMDEGFTRAPRRQPVVD
jgi:hypothetical protein